MFANAFRKVSKLTVVTLWLSFSKASLRKLSFLLSMFISFSIDTTLMNLAKSYLPDESIEDSSGFLKCFSKFLRMLAKEDKNDNKGTSIWVVGLHRVYGLNRHRSTWPNLDIAIKARVIIDVLSIAEILFVCSFMVQQL